MLYALSNDGEKVAPVRGVDAFCPDCESPMIAKCGEIMTHHWAHDNRGDCQSLSEPETEWHRKWKSYFPPEQVEVKVGSYRADAITKDGRVVEFQHSSISPETIRQRERAYERLVWVFDCSDVAEQGRLVVTHDAYDYVKWFHMRKSVSHCLKSVVLDRGTSVEPHAQLVHCRGKWGSLDGAGSHCLAQIMSKKRFLRDWCKLDIKVDDERRTVKPAERRQNVSLEETSPKFWQPDITGAIQNCNHTIHHTSADSSYVTRGDRVHCEHCGRFFGRTRPQHQIKTHA